MLKFYIEKQFFHALVKEIPPQCSKFCQKKFKLCMKYEICRGQNNNTHTKRIALNTIQHNPFNTILSVYVFVKNYFSFMHKRQVEMKWYGNHLLYPITRYGNHFVVFNSKLIVKLMSVTHFSVMVMLVLNFSFVDATNTKG